MKTWLISWTCILVLSFLTVSTVQADAYRIGILL